MYASRSRYQTSCIDRRKITLVCKPCMGAFQWSRGLRKAYPMNTRKFAATRLKKPTAIKIRRSRILHCSGSGLVSNSTADFSARLLDSLLCSVSKWKVIGFTGGGQEAHQVQVYR